MDSFVQSDSLGVDIFSYKLIIRTLISPVLNRNNRGNVSQNIEKQRDMMHKRAQPNQVVGKRGYLIPPKARCVTLEVPHNAACQLYDYKSKQSRVVFGPDLVLLQPDEQFTVLSLSGDKPKKPGAIKVCNFKDF